MITSKPGDEAVSEATIVAAGGARIITTARATARSTRWTRRFARRSAGLPGGRQVRSHHKVRILDQGHGTDAVTRVLIETSDGESSWVTVGVGHNVIEARGEPCSTR